MTLILLPTVYLLFLFILWKRPGTKLILHTFVAGIIMGIGYLDSNGISPPILVKGSLIAASGLCLWVVAADLVIHHSWYWPRKWFLFFRRPPAPQMHPLSLDPDAGPSSHLEASSLDKKKADTGLFRPLPPIVYLLAILVGGVACAEFLTPLGNYPYHEASGWRTVSEFNGGLSYDIPPYWDHESFEWPAGVTEGEVYPIALLTLDAGNSISPSIQFHAWKGDTFSQQVMWSSTETCLAARQAAPLPLAKPGSLADSQMELIHLEMKEINGCHAFAATIDARRDTGTHRLLALEFPFRDFTVQVSTLTPEESRAETKEDISAALSYLILIEKHLRRAISENNRQSPDTN